MEKDILNYSPTVMFRGTPCMYIHKILAFGNLNEVILFRVQFIDMK